MVSTQASTLASTMFLQQQDTVEIYSLRYQHLHKIMLSLMRRAGLFSQCSMFAVHRAHGHSVPAFCHNLDADVRIEPFCSYKAAKAHNRIFFFLFYTKILHFAFQRLLAGTVICVCESCIYVLFSGTVPCACWSDLHLTTGCCTVPCPWWSFVFRGRSVHTVPCARSVITFCIRSYQHKDTKCCVF